MYRYVLPIAELEWRSVFFPSNLRRSKDNSFVCFITRHELRFLDFSFAFLLHYNTYSYMVMGKERKHHHPTTCSRSLTIASLIYIWSTKEPWYAMINQTQQQTLLGGSTYHARSHSAAAGKHERHVHQWSLRELYSSHNKLFGPIDRTFPSLFIYLFVVLYFFFAWIFSRFMAPYRTIGV